MPKPITTHSLKQKKQEKDPEYTLNYTTINTADRSKKTQHALKFHELSADEQGEKPLTIDGKRYEVKGEKKDVETLVKR